jgi:integrase
MKFDRNTAATEPLPAGKKDAILFDEDTPGLGLRIREGGSRMWIFQYALGTKQRRMTLGSVKSVTLGKVRDQARDLHAKVRLGQDPASEKSEGRARAAETFKAVGERFLIRQQEKLRPRSYAQVERHMRMHTKPLHGLQLASIDRRAIATRLSAVADESGQITANRVRSTLSTFFGWAMKQGIAEHNPVIGTERLEERSRERVLSDSELRLIWTGLEDGHFGAIVKLLILTAQRASEIADLRWSEIDGDVIALPPARTKNKRAHRVPLSAPGVAILGTLPRRATQDGKPREFVFGIGQRGFSGWTRSVDRLNSHIAAAAGAPLDHWTVHDLRRTAATRMADLGVQPHVIEAVLNHASGHKAGVAGIYNRSTYEPEKRQALDILADHVLAVVEGRQSTIALLRRPA